MAFKDAYDKTTGRKVGRVPEQWFGIFKNLRKTPKAAAEQAADRTASKADSNKKGDK